MDTSFKLELHQRIMTRELEMAEGKLEKWTTEHLDEKFGLALLQALAGQAGPCIVGPIHKTREDGPFGDWGYYLEGTVTFGVSAWIFPIDRDAQSGPGSVFLRVEPRWFK